MVKWWTEKECQQQVAKTSKEGIGGGQTQVSLIDNTTGLGYAANPNTKWWRFIPKIKDFYKEAPPLEESQATPSLFSEMRFPEVANVSRLWPFVGNQKGWQPNRYAFMNVYFKPYRELSQSNWSFGNKLNGKLFRAELTKYGDMTDQQLKSAFGRSDLFQYRFARSPDYQLMEAMDPNIKDEPSTKKRENIFTFFVTVRLKFITGTMIETQDTTDGQVTTEVPIRLAKQPIISGRRKKGRPYKLISAEKKSFFFSGPLFYFNDMERPYLYALCRSLDTLPGLPQVHRDDKSERFIISNTPYGQSSRYHLVEHRDDVIEIPCTGDWFLTHGVFRPNQVFLSGTFDYYTPLLLNVGSSVSKPWLLSRLLPWNWF